jgi:hypothetical protein
MPLFVKERSNFDEAIFKTDESMGLNENTPLCGVFCPWFFRISFPEYF